MDDGTPYLFFQASESLHEESVMAKEKAVAALASDSFPPNCLDIRSHRHHYSHIHEDGRRFHGLPGYVRFSWDNVLGLAESCIDHCKTLDEWHLSNPNS